MIPDKIYVGVGTLSSIQPAEEYAFPGWQEKPYSQIRSEEFIRKDALLEWANSWLAFKRSGVVLDDGFSYAMEELIKKLNEM